MSNWHNFHKKELRVLVVDDAAMYRKIVADVLVPMPFVEVVGVAHDGADALRKIPLLQPDLLILDIGMPVMDGLEVLRRLALKSSDVGTVVLSGLDQEGSELAIQALELGAFDFIPKPQTSSLVESVEQLTRLIDPILDAFRIRKSTIRSLGKPTLQPSMCIPVKASLRSRIVAIGVSTGGPLALGKVIPQLPADIGVPIVVAQHMLPGFTKKLTERINAKSDLLVKEAEAGEVLLANTVYFAPGGRQMRVVGGSGMMDKIIDITDEQVGSGCSPSADYLFHSVAEQYQGFATGVIMTGMGRDGLEGLKKMKEKGGSIIAQDDRTSVVYGMPRWPVEEGIVDVVAPLGRIAMEIFRMVKK